MLFLENPREISFQIDGELISGLVSGSRDDWEFTSDSQHFIQLVGGKFVRKIEIDEKNFALKELSEKISVSLCKLLTL